MGRKAFRKNNTPAPEPTLEDLIQIDRTKFEAELTCSEYDKLPDNVRKLVQEFGGAIVYAYLNMGIRNEDKLKGFAHEYYRFTVAESFRAKAPSHQKNN